MHFIDGLYAYFISFNLNLVDCQDKDGYVAEALHTRLFERIQGIEIKRKKEQKNEAKKGKQKTKGQSKKQLATDEPIDTTKRTRAGPMSLVDEERAIHEAYQVLLTESHKRRAKRKRTAIKTVKNDETMVADQNTIEDPFSHIRQKSLNNQ